MGHGNHWRRAALDDPAWRRLLPVARAQGHAWTVAQAREAGYTSDMIAWRVRSAVWERPFRGLCFAAVDDAAERVRRRVACALLIAPELVAWGPSAAALHGFQVAPPDSVWLASTGESRNVSPRRGLRLVHTRQVPSDVVLVAGLRCAAAARAAVDQARVLPAHWGLAGLDRCRRLGLATRKDLDRSLGAVRGRRGSLLAARLVDWSDPRAESPPESVLRWVFLEFPDLALPQPVPQAEVVLRDGVSRRFVDVGLPAMRLAWEYDSTEHHASAARRREDRDREQQLRAVGWATAYVVWSDLATPQARRRLAETVAGAVSLRRSASRR